MLFCTCRVWLELLASPSRHPNLIKNLQSFKIYRNNGNRCFHLCTFRSLLPFRHFGWLPHLELEDFTFCQQLLLLQMLCNLLFPLLADLGEFRIFPRLFSNLSTSIAKRYSNKVAHPVNQTQDRSSHLSNHISKIIMHLTRGSSMEI